MFIMLKHWSDVVVECGEDPKMLLAAALAREFENNRAAGMIVPFNKLDINLQSKPHTIDCIQKIEFGEEYCHCCNGHTYKAGPGAINVFPGGINQASATSDVPVNSNHSSIT